MDASALFVSVPSFARHVAYGYAPPSADAEDTEDIPRLRVFVAGGADGVDVKGIATRLRNLGHIPLPFWLDAESSSDDRGGSDGDGRDGDKDKNKDADTDEDTDKDARRAWLSMRALRGAHHLLAVLSDDANPCVNAAAEIGAFLALRRESHVWIVDACGPRAAHRANVYLKDPMARLHVWGNVDALLRDMDAKHARSVPVPLLRVRADRRSKSVHDHVAARVVEDGIGGGATLEVRMPQATHARGEGRILAAATTDSRDYVFVARASDEGGLARERERSRVHLSSRIASFGGREVPVVAEMRARLDAAEATARRLAAWDAKNEAASAAMRRTREGASSADAEERTSLQGADVSDLLTALGIHEHDQAAMQQQQQ